ncbi:hypothetical protein HN873_039348, partial [Arachis hypogaea]
REGKIIGGSYPFVPTTISIILVARYSDIVNPQESTHMAFQQITEEVVYLCTGNPMPKNIEQISYWLLNEQFSDSFKRIHEIKTREGLALALANDLHFDYIFPALLNVPAEMKSNSFFWASSELTDNQPTYNP